MIAIKNKVEYGGFLLAFLAYYITHEFIITEVDYEDLEHVTLDQSKPNYEISMSNFSLTLKGKSFFTKDPKSVYITLLLNILESMRIKEDVEQITYYIVSHALTLYLIKQFEKMGIIKIIEYKKSNREYDYEECYRAILNNYEKRNISSYEIAFVKLREIEPKDLESIERLLRFFHVPLNRIKFAEKNGKVHAKLNLLSLQRIEFEATSDKSPGREETPTSKRIDLKKK